MTIREYKTADKKQVWNLIAELQDYGAQYEPGMRPGKEMAEGYLEKAILKDCAEKDGKIFVAEDNNELVGFIWVHLGKEPKDLMYYEPFQSFAYINDFMVTESYRGQGVGRDLITSVEEYAKQKGINQLKLHVVPKNDLAREVYQKMGFEEDDITLVKKL